jgi:hypothetical protein
MVFILKVILVVWLLVLFDLIGRKGFSVVNVQVIPTYNTICYTVLLAA